ncbi:MAG: hypothetical protein ACYTEQ_08220 [Planctomycetota bacterium]
MKTTRFLVILILVPGVMLSRAKVSKAAPMGTAFTYQGHLYDANRVANGIYDFQFKLFDSMTDGNQVGMDFNIPDVGVLDGYFMVVPDFGTNVFVGDARWLEISVRPSDLNDPNAYTPLSSRQRIMPTPYAIHSYNADALDSYHASAFATTSHEHDSRYYTEGESDSRFVNLTGDRMEGECSSELLGVTNNATHGAIGVKGAATSTYPSTTNYGGYFEAHGGNGHGAYGESSGNAGSGVYGKGTGGSTCGVNGEATGVQGKGVRGFATGTEGLGVYGYATGSSGIGVEGLATNNGSVTNYGGYFKAWGDSGMGVYGEAIGTNGRGIHGKATGSSGVGVYGEATGGGTAGYFQGDLHVSGNITKAFTSGTSNRAAPIAYAFINADGTVASGTPNVSCSWNGSTRRYQITIAGESYYDEGYITVVTPCTVSFGPATGSIDGKLSVMLFDPGLGATQGKFQFVTYKP